MAEPKKRGRPAGSKNKPKTDAKAPEGQSIASLSNAQRRALTFHHRSKYNELLAKKKEADAALKQHAKLIKADLGEDGLDDIKVMNQLADLGDNSMIKQRVASLMRAADFMAMPLGAEPDLFDAPDRRSMAEKAEQEGERAGLEGKSAMPPYEGDLAQAWLTGWHRGQKTLRDQFVRSAMPLVPAVREDDIDDFDDAISDTDGDETFAVEGAEPRDLAPVG